MIYEIADLRIRIENRCSFTTEFCKEYFSQIDGTFDLVRESLKGSFRGGKTPLARVFGRIYRKYLSVS